MEMSYRVRADTAIRDLLLEFECQPILFVGSGLSRRYFGAPNWIDLLKYIFSVLPESDFGFEYYYQKFDGDPIKIGTKLADMVFEWAWGDGRQRFPEELFSATRAKDCFLKYVVCDHLKEITPDINSMRDSKNREEVAFLSEIKPHAIITTNYDLFLEGVFDGYQAITGQTVLKYNSNSFGEIFHIHGDVSDYSSIVITGNDYEEWNNKKKYVSARLLTYFAEHPVFIFGYNLGDINVKSILMDIGEIVCVEGNLIPNVYLIVYQDNDPGEGAPEQAVIACNGREYRVRAIHTSDLAWVFKALKSKSALTSINLKLVRALAARTMKLVRHDIPAGIVSVNYDVLENIASTTDFLPNLLGITTIDNPNQSHPYTLTQVATRIGLQNWQAVNKLLHVIKERTGYDLRSSDNRYHCKIRTGVKHSSMTRKWSNEGVELLRKVSEGTPYEVLLP